MPALLFYLAPMDEELRSLCVLARAPGLDAARLAAAAGQAGGLERLLHSPVAQLRALGLSSATAHALAAPDAALLEADQAAARRCGLTLLPATSTAYPPLLAQVPGAPHLLWVRGRAAALAQPQLAMVGSRNPTAMGLRTAREFAHYFASVGLTITSGLARGIDAASHEGALAAGGETIAICGTGLDTDYPRSNAGLAARIAAQGALVSEFPPGTEPRRENFPQRNRIISGLAGGVLVVEAARGSGSLITARAAAEQGREVFAIPGSIHSPLSRGCHELIRQGAQLVEDAADVLAELQFIVEKQPFAHRDSGFPEPLALDNPSEILLDALGFEPTSVDALIAGTGYSSESVASMLLNLELEGRIESHPGGRYSRIPRTGAGEQTNSA
jgi:DNA processing protein